MPRLVIVNHKYANRFTRPIIIGEHFAKWHNFPPAKMRVPRAHYRVNPAAGRLESDSDTEGQDCCGA
jgi:hypothetical protein